MTTDIKGQVQAFRMRLTKLDTNGVPTPAADMMYVTSSLVSIKTSPVYKDGADLQQENGEGVTCVDYQGPPTFRHVTIEVAICTPDPYLMDFLGSCTVLTDGDAVGAAYPALGQLDTRPIGLEWWTKRVDDGQIADAFPYAWWLAPRIRNLRIGNKDFGNGVVLPTFTGQMFENPNWYDGPLNNWPVASDRVLQWVPCVSADVPAAATDPFDVATS